MIRLTLLLLCCTGFAQAKVLLFDLGGVLCYPYKLGVAQEIGLTRFLSYLFVEWRNPNIEQRIFEVLNTLPKSRHYQENAGTAEGLDLPPIMCDWQSGAKHGPAIIKAAHAQIKKLYKHGYFESKREKELIKHAIASMFNPATLAKNVFPLKEGMKLAHECGQLKNKDGTKKHRLFIFSNWDKLSFDIFFKENKIFFKEFEEIIISGHIGHIKPNADAYEYVLKKYNLHPKDCVLIDDQKVNIDGAHKSGMRVVHVDNYNFKKARIDLRRLKIL